ncbi:HipA domain-containing protein [Piscinibacter sakaiensis]|uniref:HipA domain-containing protein n=1 Tax=Piscinibacter sakaiensis TaxID=1547922 RepID=UPI00372C3921
MPSDDILLATLRRHGPLSSAELQVRLGRSQPTLSRALQRLAAEGVVALGRGRATRYGHSPALLGSVPGQQPLWRHDEHGGCERWGDLTWLGDGRVHVASRGGPTWSTQHRLPWFLAPLRLEGYLGRRWARLSPLGEQLGDDPRHWGVEQQLYAAISRLGDGPGAFTVGSPEPTARVSTALVDDAARAAHYDEVLEDERRLPPAGSSAAGEQAKFLIDRLGPGGSASALIVKFTAAPRGTPYGDRWHDLLHAEATALAVLREAGEPAALARIIATPRHTYLESERFDRPGGRGRRHVVALEALHEAFVAGPRRHWLASAETLFQQRLLEPAEVRRIALWMQFGELIGNTDMHFGNLGFWADDPARPRLAVAPCYDMLPMRFRPDVPRDELGPLPWDPPPAGAAQAWGVRERARALARLFWERVAAQGGRASTPRGRVGVRAGGPRGA